MSEEEPELKIKDKRHWAEPEEGVEKEEGEPDLDRVPTYVAKMEMQIEENDAKLKEYIAAYKQKMADNDKFRERLENDVDRRVETKTAEIFRELLPVMDNLDRALDSARDTKNLDNLIEGIDMIGSGIVATLKKFGMKEVECVGQEFDPAICEAVGVENVSEKEKDNKVTEVLQAGFLLNDKLVRPAKVKVGKYMENK